jgi:hypothetical protein
MTTISNEFEFDGPIPSIDTIVAHVSQLTGLNVIIIKQFEDEFNEYSADLAFEEFPENYFSVSVNRPDELNISFMEEAEAEYHDFDKKQIEEKFNPSPKYKKQLVEVRGYLGQETTLLNALLDTLKDLGGRQQRYLEKNDNLKINEYPVCRHELRERLRKNTRNSFLMIFVYIIMSPLILAYIVLIIIVTLITFPFELYKNSGIIKKMKHKFPDKRGPND